MRIAPLAIGAGKSDHDVTVLARNVQNDLVATEPHCAAAFALHLDPLGVRGLPGLGTVVRFVTYRGVTEADVRTAAEAVEKVVAAKPWAAAAV